MHHPAAFVKPRLRRAFLSFLAIGLAALVACRPVEPRSAQSLVNDAHLRHLMEEIDLHGERVAILHVYARYPDYVWSDAKESGPEGIACVDDAARAAVFSMRQYEFQGNREHLARARALLSFVLQMQSDDGLFFNFVLADRTINTSGRTSYASLGWWTCRAVWALGVGVRIFWNEDSLFAVRLAEALDKTIARVETLSVRYGMIAERAGYRIPQWLVSGSASDASSEMMLGLLAYARGSADPGLHDLIRKIAAGMMVMQDGDRKSYPYGLHRSWETVWHMWGNAQTQALAEAGKMLADSSMIASAEREARGWYARLLVDGFLKELDLAAPQGRKQFEQIAYCVRPMAVGLLRLHDATGKAEYLPMAGLAAAWLFGNNVPSQPMYDPGTGRCFDGINDSTNVNKNSGAESTIEALLTILEVEQYPEAAKFLHYRKMRKGGTLESPYAVFRDDAGNVAVLEIDQASGEPNVLTGESARQFVDTASVSPGMK